MIKGINKQIIEMKCTNNEYFDKVLLFVKDGGTSLPIDYLSSKGKELIGDFNENDMPKKSTFKNFLAIFLTAVFCVGVILLVLSILF